MFVIIPFLNGFVTACFYFLLMGDVVNNDTRNTYWL